MSGISGYGAVNGYDAMQTAAEAEEAAKPAEATVVRGQSGERPAATAVAPKNLEDFNAQHLQQQLESTGLSKSEAKQEVQKINLKLTADEIAKLKDDLSFYKDYEKFLLECIADPKTSEYSKAWLHWDLSDVRWEMASIEHKLAGLEGALKRIKFDVASFWRGAFTALDFAARQSAFEAKNFASVLDDREERRRADHERRRDDLAAAERNRKRVAELADRGLVRPVPPESRAALEELRELKRMADAGKLKQTEAAIEPFRAKMQSVRALATTSAEQA